jgi:hypothetical protein
MGLTEIQVRSERRERREREDEEDEEECDAPETCTCIYICM